MHSTNPNPSPNSDLSLSCAHHRRHDYNAVTTTRSEPGEVKERAALRRDRQSRAGSNNDRPTAPLLVAFFGDFLGETRKSRPTQWSKPKHCLHFLFCRKFLKITKHFTAGASRMHPKSTSSLRSGRRTLRRDTKLPDKSEFDDQYLFAVGCHAQLSQQPHRHLPNRYFFDF